MHLTVTKQAIFIKSFVEVTGILQNLEQIMVKRYVLGTEQLQELIIFLYIRMKVIT
jgi:hypothetical protein